MHPVPSTMISVSWGDHLEWGQGDGGLATPDAIQRRMHAWQSELAATTLLWRYNSAYTRLRRHFQAPGVSSRWASQRHEPGAMQEGAVVTEMAHRQGLKAYLYMAIYDEGWPLELGWHGGFEAAQSYYVLRNPDHQVVDRSGTLHHHGVLCFAYPEARRYTVGKLLMMVESGDWDGVFVCTRSQSRPAAYGDQFGFNPPVVQEFAQRYGVDIRTHDFDLDAWRRLLGDHLTTLLRAMKDVLTPRGLPLIVGIPRSHYLGPPVGNHYLDWRGWLAEQIVDGLVIDQVAAVCPSTWLTMWPRHQGYGYLENHFEPFGTRPPLEADVAATWAPACQAHGVPLYIARMWKERDPAMEAHLQQIPGVSGLVFSSFRYDNPEVCRRALWTV